VVKLDNEVTSLLASSPWPAQCGGY